jgi:hypothetical protein
MTGRSVAAVEDDVKLLEYIGVLWKTDKAATIVFPYPK